MSHGKMLFPLGVFMGREKWFMEGLCWMIFLRIYGDDFSLTPWWVFFRMIQVNYESSDVGF